MTREDTKIVFSNVAELAMFSDMFVERLEEALGSVLDGGKGDDCVGALFLELVITHYSTLLTLSDFFEFFFGCRYRLWSLHTRHISHGILQHFHILTICPQVPHSQHILLAAKPLPRH